MAKELLKFGYRKSILFPRGENLETSRATRFDRRRMWRSDRGDILRPRDFNVYVSVTMPLKEDDPNGIEFEDIVEQLEGVEQTLQRMKSEG